MRTADFDADGRDDISALATNGDLLIFKSSGDGFEPPTLIADVQAYTVGDVDGDGLSECIVYTKALQETVIYGSVLKTPSLAKIQDFVGVPLAVGDLNQDGVGDVAFMSEVEKVTVLSVAISNP